MAFSAAAVVLCPYYHYPHVIHGRKKKCHLHGPSFFPPPFHYCFCCIQVGEEEVSVFMKTRTEQCRARSEILSFPQKVVRIRATATAPLGGTQSCE